MSSNLLALPAEGKVVDAWAAGFIDGEGSFDLRPVRSRSMRHGIRFYPRLIVGQSVEAPLLLLRQEYGGAVRLRTQSRPGHRPIWEWSVAGARQLRLVLPRIEPYLLVKRRECELLHEFVDRMAAKGQGWLSDEEAQTRLDIANELRALKASGRGPRSPEPYVREVVRRPHGNAKLTTEQVAEIRAAKGATQRELAERFGVSRATIGLIRAGKIWRH